MAIPDSTPSDAIEERLNELLQNAREVKQSNTIEPPLQVSTLTADDGRLFVPVQGDKEIYTLAFERAAKNIFYSKLVSLQSLQYRTGTHIESQGSAPIQDPSFVYVWNLLDILQYCGDRGM